MREPVVASARRGKPSARSSAAIGCAPSARSAPPSRNADAFGAHPRRRAEERAVAPGIAVLRYLGEGTAAAGAARRERQDVRAVLLDAADAAVAFVRER